MILIADSGSTSTDWRYIDAQKKIAQFKTTGINPFHDSLEKIVKILQNELPMLYPSEIYFYGAGCSNSEAKKVIKQAFEIVYPQVETEVQSDILAAARSLCNDEQGIVCILGTGANACFYDGNEVQTKIPSLGYVLGDEGSGTWLGKRLIRDYFGKVMDREVATLFEQFGEHSKEYFIERVYLSDKPAAFLASYSHFISENIQLPYCYKIVYEGFQLFANNVILSYENSSTIPVHFTGSIAFAYSNILRQALSDAGLYVKNIVQSPIAGLTLYHQKSLT